MAREILFKAKRIDNGEWVEGLLWKKKYQSNKWFISCFPDKDDNEDVYVVDADTICQYTGLTDKNGNKIWENDVVKKHFYTNFEWFANSEEYIGKVEYEDCAWNIVFNKNGNKCVYPIFMAVEHRDAEYFEVIGNIFDNTELLGGSDNG